MPNPTVSVIVPIYNTAERLPNCLDSLVGQTLEAMELILIDDGSTDDSLAVCRRYEARYPDKIKVISGPNGGVCVARNKGLDAATGTWIAFCDSDDCVSKDIYKILVDNALAAHAEMSSCALHDTHYKGVDVIATPFNYSGHVQLDDHKQIVDAFFMPLLRGSADAHGFPVIHLFKRDIIEREHIRFIPHIAMMEDELFILQYLLYVSRLTAVDTPLYDYLNFDKSACATYYGKRSEHFRETNWFLRAKEQLRIFSMSNLETDYPGQTDELVLRMYLHEAQMHCCDPANSFLKKLSLLYDVARRARKDNAAHNPKGKVFWMTLLYATPLLPLLLWAKRTKDTLDAKRHHG